MRRIQSDWKLILNKWALQKLSILLPGRGINIHCSDYHLLIILITRWSIQQMMGTVSDFQTLTPTQSKPIAANITRGGLVTTIGLTQPRTSGNDPVSPGEWLIIFTTHGKPSERAQTCVCYMDRNGLVLMPVVWCRVWVTGGHRLNCWWDKQ